MLDMRKPELHAQMAASNLQNTFHTGIDHFLSPKLPIDIPIQSEDGESNDIRSPLFIRKPKGTSAEGGAAAEVRRLIPSGVFC